MLLVQVQVKVLVLVQVLVRGFLCHCHFLSFGEKEVGVWEKFLESNRIAKRFSRENCVYFLGKWE